MTTYKCLHPVWCLFPNESFAGTKKLSTPLRPRFVELVQGKMPWNTFHISKTTVPTVKYPISQSVCDRPSAKSFGPSRSTGVSVPETPLEMNDFGLRYPNSTQTLPSCGMNLSTWLKFANLDAFLVHLFVPWNDSNLMVPLSLNPWEMSQKKDTQRFCQRWMVEARQCPKWMVFLCFSWAKTDFDLVRLRRSFLQLVAETLRRLSPEKRRESIARSPSQVGTILNVRNYDIKEDITKQSSHDLGFQ